MTMRQQLFLILAVLVGAGLLVYFQLNRSPTGRPTSAPYIPAASPAAIPRETNEKPPTEAASAVLDAVMTLASDQTAAAVKTEVERVIRPRQAALAIFVHGQRRLACLLVDAGEHWFQLDHGLKAESFEALKAGLFAPPPDTFLRTVSVYRSLAKRAMRYSADGSDRLLILICPAAEWPDLNLTYHGFEREPVPLPGDAPLNNEPRF